MHGGIALDHQVVLDQVVTPAADEGGPARPVKHVPHQTVTAVAVVQVDAHRADSSHRAQVMDVVPAEHVALGRPVAPGVEGSHVGRLLGDVVDVVQFQHVFVAAVEDGRVRGIVDQVVRHAVADAVDVDAGRIGPLQSSEVMDMVVRREIAGRSQ